MMPARQASILQTPAFCESISQKKLFDEDAKSYVRNSKCINDKTSG